MNIFGNVHLGYIVIETDRFADWRRFGRDAIGMHLDETLPDVMRYLSFSPVKPLFTQLSRCWYRADKRTANVSEIGRAHV